jgi:hypothetical protein
MGGFEKVALKKAADYAALEFRKTIIILRGAFSASLSYQNHYCSIWGETGFPSDGAVLVFDGNIFPPEANICKFEGKRTSHYFGR